MLDGGAGKEGHHNLKTHRDLVAERTYRGGRFKRHADQEGGGRLQSPAVFQGLMMNIDALKNVYKTRGAVPFCKDPPPPINNSVFNMAFS